MSYRAWLFWHPNPLAGNDSKNDWFTLMKIINATSKIPAGATGPGGGEQLGFSKKHFAV
jgi:hypothetical protein